MTCQTFTPLQIDSIPKLKVQLKLPLKHLIMNNIQTVSARSLNKIKMTETSNYALCIIITTENYQYQHKIIIL